MSFCRGLNAAFYAVKVNATITSPRAKTVGHGFYMRALVAVGKEPAVLLPQMGGSPAGALRATHSNGPTIFTGHVVNMACSRVPGNGASSRMGKNLDELVEKAAHHIHRAKHWDLISNRRRR